METFSLSMETFPLSEDFTGTLRELFSMETFSLSMETFPLYGDFTGTLLYGDFFSLYGDFSSLRGLYGDSSLWRLFLSLYGDFFSLYGDFSSLRGLYGDFTATLLYGDFFSLYGDFSSLRGLYGNSSLWRLFLFTCDCQSLLLVPPLTSPSHPLSPTQENNVHQPGIEPGSH